MMQNLLFIFSFNKSRFSLLLKNAFFLCILILVAVYPFLRGKLLEYQYYLISDDVALFLSNPEQPAIVIAGSSRNGMAIHEAPIYQQFNLSSAKIPIAASSSWELVKIMNEFPEKFTHTKLIIFDLEFYQFNENCETLHQSGNSLIRLNKTLFPRVDISNVAKILRNKYTRMDMRWKVFEKNPTLIKQENMSPQIAADRHMRNYKFSELEDQSLCKLIHMCNSRNIVLVLNYPPIQKRYIEYIKQYYPEEYILFHEYMESIEKLYKCKVIALEEFPDKFGTDNDLFTDYGHMREIAAKKYTNWLLTQMESDEVLVKMYTLNCMSSVK